MADEKKNQSYFLKTPTPTAFLTVLEPRKIGNKGDPVFSAELLLDPEGADYKAIGALIRSVAQEAFPGRDLKTLKFPVEKGDSKVDSDPKGRDRSFYKGKIVLKARADEDHPPALFVPAGKDVRELTGAERTVEGKGHFYNGAVVLAGLWFKAYKGSKDGGIGEHSGVKAYLQSVCYVSKGQRIGGSEAAEQFKAYMGTVSTEDPTGGDVDDEIPF